MELTFYLRNNKKTRLIFDFDETLLKIILPWERWEDKIKEKLIELDPKIYKNYKEKNINLSDLENEYVLKYGIDNLIKENCADFESAYFKDFIPNDKLIKFVENTKDYKIFVWSSNTKPTVEKALRNVGILNKFEKIITRTDLRLIKPYDEGFEKIYDPFISKRNYLLIGNSQSDMKAAKNSGIDFFLVDYFKGNLML